MKEESDGGVETSAPENVHSCQEARSEKPHRREGEFCESVQIV